MKLVIEQGERAGQEFRLSRPSVVIGRSQECDIVLAEQGISRQHARLEQARGAPGAWTVTDLGTRNGTFLNGQQIPTQQPVPLQAGDRLAIGSSVLALQLDAQPGPASALSRHPLLSVAGAALFLLLLAAVVALLVTLLQPGESNVPTPTQGNPIEQLITVVPVPTQIQEVIPSVIPLIPTGLPFFPPAATETPPPPAVSRGSGGGGP